METITDTSVLVCDTCCKCGIRFAMPRDWQRQRLDKHDGFFCPAGHEQYYSCKSELEKAKEEASREKMWRENAERRERAAIQSRQAAERKAAAARGVVTKIKKRIGNGVCPCCNRHFVNVERHMETKHPEYAGMDE